MKKLTLLLILVLTTTTAIAQNYGNNGNAQGRPRFNQQEFRRHMQEFITKEGNLTEAEAKAFFPIFNEYKNKQRELNMNIHALKRENSENENEKAYEERLMQIARLNTEMAELDSVYYKKICKVISAKKFFKILNIEDRMHRKMLQNYNREPSQRMKNKK
ncbi:MAG: hypothetical protein IKT87_01600 [Bacteroidaceae bacterium]|nr:hypothetical protein [Bacteroidaceae bacterium]